MLNANMPSLADIAAVTDNKDGFGGNNGWWILIILFALFGWGRGGYGFGGGDGVGENYVLATDFATLERKLDGVNNGICSLGYDQLGQINATQAQIAAGFNGVDNAVCTLGYQNAQLINGLSAQLAQCCCDNRAEIAQVRYDMATNNCATNTLINQQAQNIMLNCNENYRQLNDRLTQMEMSAKDETIANLRAQLDKCDLATSQARQNEYLISRLQPAPVPAYQVANPYCNCGNFNSCCNC